MISVPIKQSFNLSESPLCGGDCILKQKYMSVASLPHVDSFCHYKEIKIILRLIVKKSTPIFSSKDLCSLKNTQITHG